MNLKEVGVNRHGKRCKPNDPVSLDERRRKRRKTKSWKGGDPQRSCGEDVRRAQETHGLHRGRFGLEEPYNDKVLSMLLFACEECEEPPFKLYTDIGWLWRGYCLAYNVASSIRGARIPSQQPTIPRVAEGGGEGLCRSWRRLAFPAAERGYAATAIACSRCLTGNMPSCRRSSTGCRCSASVAGEASDTASSAWFERSSKHAKPNDLRTKNRPPSWSRFCR